MTSPTYFTLVTTKGQDDLTAALGAGQTVPIASMALGDGGGNPVVPAATMTALVNQVYSAAPSAIAADPDNANWLQVTMVVPMNVGGWTVREVGLFTEAGDLFAIGNFPDTYKPILTDGSARELTINMIIQVANAATVTLNIDPSITLATVAALQAETAAREAADTAEATTRAAADTAEAAARQQGDTNNAQAITAEANTRAAAVTAEANTRAAADTVNANAIAAEATTRAAAVTAEANARAAADTAEANTRAAADTANAASISALAATASLARIYFMGR